jgi:hypothetical protein
LEEEVGPVKGMEKFVEKLPLEGSKEAAKEESKIDGKKNNSRSPAVVKRR